MDLHKIKNYEAIDSWNTAIGTQFGEKSRSLSPPTVLNGLFLKFSWTGNQFFSPPQKNTDGKTRFHTQHHFHLFYLNSYSERIAKFCEIGQKFLSVFLYLVMCEKKIFMNIQYLDAKIPLFLKSRITEGSTLSQSHLTQPTAHSKCTVGKMLAGYSAGRLRSGNLIHCTHM